MKKIILAISALVIIASCKEQVPTGLNTSTNTISTLDTTFVKDTTLVAQNKQILIEELTGVSCQPCGSFGTQLLSNVKNTYPNKVVVARIYCGLNNKINPTDSVLGNDADANSLMNFLQNNGQPCASIDRYNNGGIPSNSGYTYGRNSWLAGTASLVNNTTPVNIYAVSNYNSTTKKINLNTSFIFTDTTTQKLAYDIYLIENNIIAGQDTIGGKVDSFVHNEVLRKCLTNVVTGVNLLDTLTTIEKHRQVYKNLVYDLPSNVVNYHNCKIIIFIHNRITKQVLHVQEIDL